MQISIANAILVARLVGKSIVRRGLKMWLDFKKSNIIGCEIINPLDFTTWVNSGSTDVTANGFTTDGSGTGVYYNLSSNNNYKINVSGVVGDVELRWRDGGGGGILLGDFDTDLYFNTLGLSNPNIYLRSNTATVATVTSVSFKEVAQFVPDESNNCNEAKLFTGKALSFDGVNDSVDFTSVSLSSEFTIALWFKVGSGVENWIGNNADGISNSYFNGGNSLKFKINYSSATFSFPSFTDTYSRLVVTRDSSNNVRAYVNDKESTSGSFVKSGVFKFDTLGRERTSYGDIILSDFQYYTAKWDEDDVTFDYANPNKLVFNNSASSISVSNLKGYYALSEGSGSIAYDSATPLGSDLVVDGDFPTGTTAWTITSGVSIQSNKAIITTSDSSIQYISNTDCDLLNGVDYIITFTANRTSGNGKLAFTNNVSDNVAGTPLLDSSGDFVINFTPSSNITGFGFKRHNSTSVWEVSDVSVKEVSVGTITGATYVPRQTTIPQLGMVDWAKSTSDGTNEITLIQNPNELGKDILGNTLRLREGGFNLDGSGYGSIANDTTLQFGTTAFTIQAWIKPFSLIANHRIITKGVTGNGEWMLSIGTNCIRVYAQDSSGNALDTSSTFSVLTLDVWQMITVVIDTPNDKILFYLNNGSVEEKTGASWSGNFNNTLPITIGNTSSLSSGQFFDGIVDESLIYNIELSSKEVLNNYKVGLPKHS